MKEETEGDGICITQQKQQLAVVCTQQKSLSR